MKPPFFGGHHRLLVDDKNRLFLPQAVREAIDVNTHGDSLYIVITRQSLLIYPKKYYEYRASVLFPLDITPDEALEKYKQQMFGTLSEATWDKQGRISISDFALQRAGIKREVALIGMQDHLELWNRADWDKRLDELLEKGREVELQGQESLRKIRRRALENQSE